MKTLIEVSILLLGLISHINPAYAKFDCGDLWITAFNVTKAFYSPSYQQPVTEQIYCTYEIQPRTDKKLIKIVFNYFKIKNSADCNTNYVKIWDGKELNGDVLSLKCGEDSPEFVISATSLVTLQYKAESQAFGEGFEAEVLELDRPDAADCGSLSVSATRDAQIFKSYGQGNHIPYKIECTYKITANYPNMFLTLNFEKFNISGKEPCEQSYVKIYDGEVLGNPMVTKCGADSPGKVQSTGQVMTVVYVAPDQSLKGGFQAKLQQEVICGQTNLKASEVAGTLKSPGDGAELLSDINCIYTITATQPEKTVNIKFTQFKIVHYPTCDLGYVKIWDSEQTDTKLLSVKCGEDSPGVVTSSSGKLIIQYMVDGQNLGEGFTAEYKEVNQPVSATCDTPSMTATDQVQLFKSSGQGNRMNFPIDCKHIITAQDAEKIVIMSFVKFDIVNTDNCAASYVKIYDGEENKGVLLKTKCGTDSPGIVRSTGQKLTVVYKAPNQALNGGFQAQIQQVQKSTAQCDQRLTVQAGGSENINVYESSLYRGQQCLVSINTNGGYRLELKFEVFQFSGSNGSCTDSDYLQMGDGSTLQAGAAKMCGGEPPGKFLSSSNEMFINYIAMDLAETMGFKATVKSVSAACLTKLSILYTALLATYSIFIV